MVGTRPIRSDKAPKTTRPLKLKAPEATEGKGRGELIEALTDEIDDVMWDHHHHAERRHDTRGKEQPQGWRGHRITERPIASCRDGAHLGHTDDTNMETGVVCYLTVGKQSHVLRALALEEEGRRDDGDKGEDGQRG